MSNITLQLSPDTERLLREKARRQGQTLESYLQHLAEQDARSANGLYDPASQVSLAEFERGLDDLSAGLPPIVPLPADFSRADIYAEHD